MGWRQMAIRDRTDQPHHARPAARAATRTFAGVRRLKTGTERARPAPQCARFACYPRPFAPWQAAPPPIGPIANCTNLPANPVRELGLRRLEQFSNRTCVPGLQRAAPAHPNRAAKIRRAPRAHGENRPTPSMPQRLVRRQNKGFVQRLPEPIPREFRQPTQVAIYRCVK